MSPTSDSQSRRHDPWFLRSVTTRSIAIRVHAPACVCDRLLIMRHAAPRRASDHSSPLIPSSRFVAGEVTSASVIRANHAAEAWTCNQAHDSLSALLARHPRSSSSSSSSRLIVKLPRIHATSLTPPPAVLDVFGIVTSLTVATGAASFQTTRRNLMGTILAT